MTLVGPKVPDANYPPQVSTEGITSTEWEDSADKRDDNDIPIPALVKLVISALRFLRNRKGSSVADIQRFLSSEGYVFSAGQLRAAIIQAMKEGTIQRPPSAVEKGVYGLYILVEGKTSHKSRRHARGNTRRSRSTGGK
ncbi:unnamed protein product [Candidula unifasciata]|uniref:H15 domain-containing protein n=1 Tax=Candidula unifasciata TaxID=100452 RepID=A0A8S4A5F6_9EUPU|nr:unnamed protein product [Candidula unifasciata]